MTVVLELIERPLCFSASLFS